MRKKFLSYLAIFSLIMGLFVMGQTNTIYADNTKLNPDDMESILNDISSVGKAWESMGFQSQDISEIMQLPRKNSNFYKEIEASVNELSNASKETKKIENTLMKQETITLYSQDGNPPSGVEEQNERIKYVTQVALDRYGSVYNSEQFNKYVVYLYMSHYIDNPNYTRENPGFDNIYAYVITNDDIRAYDKFIEQTKYSMFSENVVNFINDYKSAVDNIVGLTGSIADSKIVSFNTLNSIYGLKDFNPNKMVTRAAMIAESFNKNYENAVTAEALINAICEDLKYEDVGKQYIDTCVTGLLGALAGTTSILGFGLSISVCYYNIYMNLYDKAKIAALHYSLSGRVAERLDVLLWE